MRCDPNMKGNESALTSGTPYAYLLKGDDGNDFPIYWAGSFTPDGTGGITAADIDFEGQTDGPSSFQVQLAGSSYSYGADGRGCLYIAFNSVNGTAIPAAAKTSGFKAAPGTSHKHGKLHPQTTMANVGTVTFSFALSQGKQSGRITQFDYINSFFEAAGQMHQQTPADFSIDSLASKFAFGLDGWVIIDSSGDIDRAAVAGSVTNSSGTLGTGVADANFGGTPTGEASGGSGTLAGSTVSTSTGRGTGSFTIDTTTGTFAFDFVYYIVNKSDLFIISADTPELGTYLVAGRALEAASTATAPNGYYVPILSGIDLSSGDGIGNNVVSIGTAQLTSNGAVTSATLYQNDGGAYTTQTYSNGSYTLETATGRISFSGVSTTPPVGYMTATAAEDDIAAFLVGTDGANTSGYLALQGTAAPNFSTSSVSGNFIFGTSEDVVGVTGTQVGVFNFTGSGGYSATVDVVDVQNQAGNANQAFNGTVSINSDGSGSFDSGNVTLVTGGSAIVAIDATNTSQPQLYYLLQQVTPE